MSANKENENEKQDEQNPIKSPNMDLEQLLPLLIQQAISGISKSIPDIIDQHLAQRGVISVLGSDNIDTHVKNDQRNIGACIRKGT